MDKVFISYSHKDEEWKDRLVTHLRVLEKQGVLDVWDDRRLEAGGDWRKEIEEALGIADIAILMITANFLTSDFIVDKEVPRILDRRGKEGLWVIPVFVKPCAWEEVEWLAAIEGRPVDGKELSTMADHEVDTALKDLTKEIAERVSDTAKKASPGAKKRVPKKRISLAKLPTTGHELFGREQELAVLDRGWGDEHTHILSLVAWGGVGKTALVNEWLNRMERDNYRGAERVYGWSFYSQGTREERQVSGDEFFAYALKWFGDADPAAGSPWDKGVRLAELVRDQRTLLILDGLEPLQYPPGAMEGRLKDQGLQALLKELASSNDGLCVITTREAVKDVERAVGAAVKRVYLEELSVEAGVELLKSLGIKGTEGELGEAVKDFVGHALALNLLGTYLDAVHEGEIRKRDLVPHLADEEKQGGHAKRVMESYERWLKGTAELDILYLMGLFDRPAPGGAIAVLREEPGIEGLTDRLQGLSEAKWKYAVRRLRELRLLGEADEGDSGKLDCHPLVREHFGEKLKLGNAVGWREAHGRLYEYYKGACEKELPGTLAEMEPLFAAVGHGCQAGRYQEAHDEVYGRRILRGNEYYIWRKLGAFGAWLAVLSGFFEKVWSQPVSELKESTQAIVLSQAGFGLRALGRLREGAEPMEAGQVLRVKQKDWNNAAINAGNLSQLYLTSGDVEAAVDYGRLCVEYADKSGNVFHRMAHRTQVGDVLHQAGQAWEARGLFEEAEGMQKERQPEYPLLYSVQGFYFCDLILSGGGTRRWRKG